MIRFISTVLVIWGLIAQPLMAAMPIQMANDSTRSMMVSHADMLLHANEHSDAATQHTGEYSKMLCHEQSIEQSSSEPCNQCQCDANCLNNSLCASSCMTSAVAATQKSAANFDLQRSLRVAPPEAHTHRLPSKIFHPPKYS